MTNATLPADVKIAIRICYQMELDAVGIIQGWNVNNILWYRIRLRNNIQLLITGKQVKNKSRDAGVTKGIKPGYMSARRRWQIVSSSIAK